MFYTIELFAGAGGLALGIEKRLQYPVNISQPNPKMAQFIMSQYGGLKCYNR